MINLEAILNLPKGTEHFLTDIHGEYEAFSHVPVSYTHLDVYKRQTEKTASEYANTGKTPMYVVIDGRLAGIVCVADTIKETLSLIHIS